MRVNLIHMISVLTLGAQNCFNVCFCVLSYFNWFYQILIGIKFVLVCQNYVKWVSKWYVGINLKWNLWVLSVLISFCVLKWSGAKWSENLSYHLSIKINIIVIYREHKIIFVSKWKWWKCIISLHSSFCTCFNLSKK